MEKIFANHICDKIPRISKELLQLSNKKIKLIKQSNKHMKRYSTSLIIREMHFKTARCHLTHIRMVNIWEKENNKCR